MTATAQLNKIFLQDKSDTAVLKEALSAGYNGTQIRRALIKTYPLDFPDAKTTFDFYHNALSRLSASFFLKLPSRI